MSCPNQLIGMGLLGGSLLSAMPNRSSFEDSLTNEQLSIWKYIQNERFSIYFMSLSVALLVSRATNTDKWTRVVLMCLLTASLYMITPKFTYMSNHLRTDQQPLLRKIYIEQQLRYYGSVTLAIIAAPFVC
jgi:intracellular septation protein A